MSLPLGLGEVPASSLGRNQGFLSGFCRPASPAPQCEGWTLATGHTPVYTLSPAIGKVFFAPFHSPGEGTVSGQVWVECVPLVPTARGGMQVTAQTRPAQPLRTGDQGSLENWESHSKLDMWPSVCPGVRTQNKSEQSIRITSRQKPWPRETVLRLVNTYLTSYLFH